MIKYSASVIGVSCAYVVMKFCGINNYKCLYSKNVVKEEIEEKNKNIMEEKKYQKKN